MSTKYLVYVNGSTLNVPSNFLKNIVDDFVSLSYVKRINEVGMFTMTLPIDHEVLDTIELDAVVVVRRGSDAITWYSDFTGLYRGATRDINNNNEQTLNFYIPDGNSLLERTLCAYYTGHARSNWTSEQTYDILTDLAAYNMNITGPTGRLIDPRELVNVPSYTGAGSTIGYSAAFKTLLAACQEVANIDDYIFSMSSGDVVPAWTFAINSLGTDRSQEVYFQMERGNIADLSLDQRRLNEPTKILIAGQGEGSSRTYVVRTSADYATNNHTEYFMDARDLTLTASLNARADAKLAETAYKPKFTFNALQAPNYLYGRDYFLGDKISAYYAGTWFTLRITGVTVNVNGQGEESIGLELKDAA